MSSDSGSGTSAMGRAPAQTGGISGYFHGFFGTSRKMDPHAEPIRIPSRSEVADIESKFNCRSPPTPPIDDWTFGIFRSYSSSDEGASLPQSNAMSGYNLAWSSKPLPTENNQLNVGSDSSSPAKTIAVGEISSRVRRDSDVYLPTSTSGKDIVDAASKASQEFGKGAILSAYMSQQGQSTLDVAQATQGQGQSQGAGQTTQGADGNAMKVNVNLSGSESITNVNASSIAMKPGTSAADSAVSSAAAPHLMTKRKSLFDNERLEVNRKELNMMAPTSM